MKSLLRAFRYMRNYIPAATGQLLCMLLGTAGMLLIPRLQQIIIDRGIDQNDLNVVILFAVLMVGLGAGARHVPVWPGGSRRARLQRRLL